MQNKMVDLEKLNLKNKGYLPKILNYIDRIDIFLCVIHATLIAKNSITIARRMKIFKKPKI